ncbi:TolC family protein, partial [Pirellulaceae bacterium]|nr:TolC family protein [Pirellulaceae bacterium]
MDIKRCCWVTICLVLLVALDATSQDGYPRIFPEQRTLQIRSPDSLPKYDIYTESYSQFAPETVLKSTRNRIITGESETVQPRLLSLDEAIQIALEKSEVVRVLGGLAAANSGRTIYDAAISNTAIDVNQAAFDPAFFFNNTFSKTETPTAVQLPGGFGTSQIVGRRADGYNMGVGLTKESVYGTTGSLSMNTVKNMFRPGFVALDPAVNSTLEVGLTQPLLRGADPEANLASVVIARINTERSYFQYKNSVQNLVRGVVEAYWNLVFARVDVWVRDQQYKRANFDLQRIKGRVNRELDNKATEAQSQVAFLNFKSNLITAKATQLQRESALRNLLGLPPEDGLEIVPTSTLGTEQLPIKWQELLVMAETYRPDIVELKLVIEADSQTLVQNLNQALPSMDAVAQYRWNGLAGEMPNTTNLSTRFGQFTDWSLGVNFSVPLGLRQSRAGVRQAQLIIARDKANLRQGLHAVVHELASNVRTLDQNYYLYEVFKESREAALFNLERQIKDFENGRSIYLNVLLAITDWGNAVSNEASTLTQYNISLAELERITGTILESHGVRFVEERFGAVGPVGSWSEPIFYPYSNPSTPNDPRYPDSGLKAESQFNLEEIGES